MRGVWPAGSCATNRGSSRWSTSTAPGRAFSMSPFTPDLDLFGISRVAVLPGPQGTLLGWVGVGHGAHVTH